MADEQEQGPTLYQRVRGFLLSRRKSYQRVFDSEEGRNVLADLAKFCRAHESTFHPDERTSCLLDGRHEVWLRIKHHLNLTDEELWALYGRGRGTSE